MSQSLLEILKSIDVSELEKELAGLEEKLAAATRTYASDIAAIKQAIKLAKLAQGEKVERKKREPKPAKTAAPAPRLGSTIADRAATYLEAAGTATAAAIARGIQLENPASIYAILYAILDADRRFEKTATGTYRLSGRS